MMYSSPSSLTSVPEYLLVMTFWPFWTVHLDLLAVNDAAGADLDDLRYLRLFLERMPVRMIPLCGGLLRLYHFNDNTVAKGLEFHNGLPPMKNKNIHCRELSTQNI